MKIELMNFRFSYSSGLLHWLYINYSGITLFLSSLISTFFRLCATVTTVDANDCLRRRTYPGLCIKKQPTTCRKKGFRILTWRRKTQYLYVSHLISQEATFLLVLYCTVRNSSLNWQIVKF